MARAAAAQALGQLDNARAVQPLIEALDDDDQSVQQAVARSLQQLAPKAMDQLIDALRTSRYWFRRQKVAETIGRIGEQGPLADALSHEDRHVRRQAAEDLARLGGVQAVEPLADALIRDEDSYVRRKAAEALGKSGNINAVWPLIQALLDDEDWLVRWVAAEAMGSIGHSSAVKSLITALKDDEWPVRWMAAKALGKIGDKSAVGPLIEALKDNWPTMWAVAETLGQLEDDRAVEPLVAALWDSDSDKYLRQAAVEALARIGAAIQGPLIEVLREGDEEARQRAIAALGQMEGPRDLTPLIEALSSGPSYEVWQGAMDALVQIGEPAVEPLIAVLQGGDWMARRRVARTLGQIGNTQAVRPLIEALGDSIRAVRQAAAEALHHVDSPQARAALRKYRQEFPEDLTSDEE